MSWVTASRDQGLLSSFASARVADSARDRMSAMICISAGSDHAPSSATEGSGSVSTSPTDRMSSRADSSSLSGLASRTSCSVATMSSRRSARLTALSAAGGGTGSAGGGAAAIEAGGVSCFEDAAGGASCRDTAAPGGSTLGPIAGGSGAPGRGLGAAWVTLVAGSVVAPCWRTAMESFASCPSRNCPDRRRARTRALRSASRRLR